MDAEINSLVINGKEYVLKSAVIQEISDEDYVIVRTQSAGVFAGNLVKREGQEVVLKNARRLWYWQGAASLSQMAMEGTSRPDQCQFPCPVTEIVLTQAIEIIPCTKKAMESIRKVKIWKV